MEPPLDASLATPLNQQLYVPIFVLTHQPPATPPKQDDRLTYTFVTAGAASAVSQAKAATETKDVQVVGGAGVIQELLREGLVDELLIDIMPVLLGDGQRLFAGDDAHVQNVRLELLRVETVGPRAGLRYAVNR